MDKSLYKKIYNPKIVNTVEIIGLICTVEIIISFILSTYNPPYTDILVRLDYISICYFTFEVIYKFIGTKNKTEFFKSIYNIIDTIIIVAFALYTLQIIYSKAVVGLRVINAVRVLVLLRVIKFRKLHLSPETINFITILTFSFILSCFIWLAENEVNPKINNFADAFYFTVISITTIGYGDITPQTMWGKMIIVLAVLYIISGLMTRAQKVISSELEKKE
jgi:voltage-gated potassium channel